jgi:hypothetical protein
MLVCVCVRIYNCRLVDLRMLSRVGVTYRPGFGLDDWIYCTLYIHNSGLQVLQSYRYPAHSQFTLAHALGFSVFTSRILATDFTTVSLPLKLIHEVCLAQSNSCVTISAATNSDDSTQFNFSYPARLASRNSTLFSRLLSILHNYSYVLPNTFHGPRRNTTFIVKEACLLVRYLASITKHAYASRECLYRVVA